MMITNLYSAYMIRGNVNSSDIIEEIKITMFFLFNTPPTNTKNKTDDISEK